MRNVSLFVAHGPVVWQVLLALAALAGLGIAWALPRRALGRRAARVRDALGTPARSLDASVGGKPVVLVGTVKRPDALDDTPTVLVATLTPEGMELAEEPSQKAITAVVDGAPLVLEVDGQRVFVEGAAQVLVGSRETGATISPKHARLALWELASELRPMKNAPHGVRVLCAGDRVRARGVLRHEPDASTPQTYRSGSGAYFLSPGADEAGQRGGVVPVVFDAGPRPLAEKRLASAARALAMPACAIALLGAVGEVAARTGEVSPTAASIAAMTPFRRADGLAHLRAHAARTDRPDEASLARIAEVDRLRGLCGTASDDWLLGNRPERAAEVAASCGDPSRAARAWFVHGDMAHAAESFREARRAEPKMPASVSEVTAYVAIDDREAASKAAHALLATWDGDRGSREKLACVVDALDARTMGTSDQGALESHAAEDSHRLHCTLLLAETLPTKERRARLAGLRYEHRAPVLVAAAAFAADPTRGERDLRLSALSFPALDLLTRPKALVFEVPEPVALEAARDARGEDDADALVLYTYMTTRRAALRSYLGDEAKALEALDEVEARLAPLAKRTYTDAQWHAWENRRYSLTYSDQEGDYERAIAAEERRLRATYDPKRDAAERAAESLREHARSVRAVVLLRGGKSEAARKLLPPERTFDPAADLLRRFVDVAASWDPRGLGQLGAGDGRESNRKLWLLAEAGDGQALASKLREQAGDGRGVVEVAGAHLPTGREDLARWVRYGYPAPCTTCGLFPLMNHLASRRDAAVATGDAETVKRTTELRERLDTVLARRESALVLHFLSELFPP